MLGLLPMSPIHIIWLFVPVVVWGFTRPLAKRMGITIWHNAAFGVAYWEEILFRGLIYGVALAIWDSAMFAIVLSSLLFGLFHLRNLWWSSSNHVIKNCMYNGIFVGPMLGILRWVTGDIYLGIALHALHNLMGMYITRNKIPKDNFLRSKKKEMNWFERLFSGMWT